MYIYTYIYIHTYVYIYIYIYTYIGAGGVPAIAAPERDSEPAPHDSLSHQGDRHRARHGVLDSLTNVCAMTHAYVCHGSLLCVT